MSAAQGGAIAALGGGDLIVDGGVFQQNVGAEGSALSVISSRSLKVSNTSFDDPAGAFAGEATEVQVRALVYLLQFAS
jgi:hypothetical protein